MALQVWSMVHGIATLLLDDRIEEHGGMIDPLEVVTTFVATFKALGDLFRGPYG